MRNARASSARRRDTRRVSNARAIAASANEWNDPTQRLSLKKLAERRSEARSAKHRRVFGIGSEQRPDTISARVRVIPAERPLDWPRHEPRERTAAR